MMFFRNSEQERHDISQKQTFEQTNVFKCLVEFRLVQTQRRNG